MLTLGIDPGTRKLGYGVVDGDTYIECGICKANPKDSIPDRIASMVRDIESVLDDHVITDAAMETAFVGQNVTSALKLGEVRGAIRQLLVSRGIPVAEYAPNTVKLAVAGFGRATKDQVLSRVVLLLGLDRNNPPAEDASDALAIAMAHERLRGT